MLLWLDFGLEHSWIGLRGNFIKVNAIQSSEEVLVAPSPTERSISPDVVVLLAASSFSSIKMDTRRSRCSWRQRRPLCSEVIKLADRLARLLGQILGQFFMRTK